MSPYRGADRHRGECRYNYCGLPPGRLRLLESGFSRGSEQVRSAPDVNGTRLAQNAPRGPPNPTMNDRYGLPSVDPTVTASRNPSVATNPIHLPGGRLDGGRVHT